MAYGAAYRDADATVSAYNAKDVTPNDVTALAVTRGLYIGTGGTVHVTMAYKTEVTFANVPDGSILPVQVVKVWAAGTSASDIIALY